MVEATPEHHQFWDILIIGSGGQVRLLEIYNYKAISHSGVTVDGSISGENYQKVVEKLEQDGLQPYSLEKVDDSELEGKQNISHKFPTCCNIAPNSPVCSPTPTK